MSALAHYLEDEGIATATIALLRVHAERVEPPRALWVPFELGRPLGPPGDAAFQLGVIRAALALLERADGPVVLEDFPHDAPDLAGDPDWAPPSLAATTLRDEIDQMRPHYERARERRGGRTTVGLAKVPVETAAAFIERIDSADPMPNPVKGYADVQVLRFGADDLKAFYLEGAMAAGGRPSSRQLTDWFWSETLAARTLLALRDACGRSEDENRKLAQRWLVPEAQLERLGIE